MRKILALLLLCACCFCFLCSDNTSEARGSKKKSKGGFSAAQLKEITTDLDTLTQKVYEASLFSPKENAKLAKMKMQLDDQMLAAPDPSYAPMYYKLGNLFKSREYKNEAIECYQTILENFSDTALAPKATKALTSLGVVVKVKQPEEEDEE